MENAQVVILAAGQGTRLHPLTQDCPKSLISFNSEPLLVRTVSQLYFSGFKSIRIVIGHLSEQIKSALHQFHGIEFIYNDEYSIDKNSLSLHLGLEGINSPVLVIEGDVVLTTACYPYITSAFDSDRSIWFTQGLFQKHQVGGIIKSDASNRIEDMRIVSGFTRRYETYSKNLGLVYISTNEIDYYKLKLKEGVKKSASLYYMDYWIKHLDQLPANEIALPAHSAGSFNTPNELEYCRQIIKST